ncbi:DnaJ domain-containing protein [Halopseudomonas sp.]|uniref:DnaJ domain-containing protein n=1 Tax=Halopseudomonas sp. TaxID=2901191 RepID=UPI00311DCD2B
MLWPVTVLGALVGGLGGAVPGAVLGAVVGHALDRHWQLRHWRDLPDRLAQLRGAGNSFERVLFLCMGRLAKASGRVTQGHLQLARDLMQQYRLEGDARLQAMHDFNEGKQGGDLIKVVRELCRREPGRAAELMDSCWRMGVLPGRLSDEVRELLAGWSKVAGLGQAEQQRMHRRHQHRSQGRANRAAVAQEDRLQQAASLLKVSLSDSPEVIKRAYRRQLSLHHPDKLAARGVSAAQQSGAGERIRQIQQAYETLRRHRGFR